MKKCYDCTHVEMCGWRKEVKEQGCEFFDDGMVWIPVKWHEILEEEREQEGYPKDWEVYLDCEMPSDGQKILVTTRWGTVEADMCYEDGEFSLDSGYDWIEDIVAWMPLPEPYKGGDNND